MFVLAFAALASLAALASAPRVSAQGAATDSLAGESDLQKRAREAAAAAAAGKPLTIPDSLESAPVGIRFKPIYLNQIVGDVSSVGMKNSFQTNMSTPFGSMFNFSVSADEKHYRLQNKLDENKLLSATMLHTFNVFTNGSIGFTDSRVFNRSIIPGGAVQDYIFNDKSVSAGATYLRTHEPHSHWLELIRYDARGSGAAVQSERTYKNDQTLAAGGFGGVAAEMRKGTLLVDGRGGRRETWDRSETTLTTFDGLGSWEDSLSTGLLAEIGDSIFVDASYTYYQAERTWADQAQGSLGGQQGGAQNVFQETEQRATRGTVIALNAKVWNQLRLKVIGNHDSQLNQYAVQTTRYSNNVTDGITGELNYTAPWRTVATLALENVETLRDLGPQSVSSYTDIRKRAGISFRHQFTKTFSMELGGFTMLTRSEYLDPVANPRDRDQVDNSAALKFNSLPFEKLSANVSLSYSGQEIINIKESQSENNRTRTLYELRPGFVYYFNDQFLISQSYAVVIEYTDFVFTPTSNFLDRNLIFTNKFDFRPSKRINFVFDYAYNFHDNGSYLPDPVTGEDELSVQGEDRRDRVNLRLEYRVMDRIVKGPRLGDPDMNRSLQVFAEQRYNRFEDQVVGLDESDVTTDGQITVGSRGDYDFGSGRTLKFSIARVKRFSQFGSEAEKNFWDMRSEFNYPF